MWSDSEFFKLLGKLHYGFVIESDYNQFLKAQMHESGVRNRIELKLHKSCYNRKEEKVLCSFYQKIYAYCLYERNLRLKRIAIITAEEEYRFKSYFSKILLT